MVDEVIAAREDMLIEAAAALPDNVTPFPAEARVERTLPRWTEEFPIEPKEFVERDFDYPLEWHAVDVEEYPIAAGEAGVFSESDMAEIIHAKDIREGRKRVIRVVGDSMSPEFNEGEKYLVDVTVKNPAPGDPVAVYLKDQGSILGYWERTHDGIRLLKENERYAPVQLIGIAGEDWRLIGLVTRCVDKPVRRKKKT